MPDRKKQLIFIDLQMKNGTIIKHYINCAIFKVEVIAITTSFSVNLFSMYW